MSNLPRVSWFFVSVIFSVPHVVLAGPCDDLGKHYLRWIDEQESELNDYLGSPKSCSSVGVDLHESEGCKNSYRRLCRKLPEKLEEAAKLTQRLSKAVALTHSSEDRVLVTALKRYSTAIADPKYTLTTKEEFFLKNKLDRISHYSKENAKEVSNRVISESEDPKEARAVWNTRFTTSGDLKGMEAGPIPPKDIDLVNELSQAMDSLRKAKLVFSFHDQNPDHVKERLAEVVQRFGDATDNEILTYPVQGTLNRGAFNSFLDLVISTLDPDPNIAPFDDNFAEDGESKGKKLFAKIRGKKPFKYYDRDSASIELLQSQAVAMTELNNFIEAQNALKSRCGMDHPAVPSHERSVTRSGGEGDSDSDTEQYSPSSRKQVREYDVPIKSVIGQARNSCIMQESVGAWSEAAKSIPPSAGTNEMQAILSQAHKTLEQEAFGDKDEQALFKNCISKVVQPGEH